MSFSEWTNQRSWEGLDKKEKKCPECGGNCAPECGRHPMGCIYGGFSESTGYWLVVDGCELDHDSQLIAKEKPHQLR